VSRSEEEVLLNSPAGEDDPRVLRAVEEYLAAREAGAAPDRPQFLAQHADIADSLARCLDGLDFIHQAVAPLRTAVGEAAMAADASAPPGTPLGDFCILREVGRGGMGIVYEAEQISLCRRVALKVLPFASTLDPRHLQRFHNEARAAAGLHHTNIVPVYAVGCERGVHFYAMQFIDGQSLAGAIAELRKQTWRSDSRRNVDQTGPYQPADALDPPEDTRPAADRSTARTVRDAAHFRAVAQLGSQAAEALDHAHQQGVVHRDVKPANLLLDTAGRLWVTDFGLAQVQSDTRLTLTGDLVGTLRYMSPEQALAKRVVVDHRTDVYSLGATLYELLTLEPVFPGTDRQELLRQIAFEEPRAPRRLNRAVPPELETIVLKAQEKNPGERYATAQELADDLERYLKDEPIRARRPTLVQRARKWSRRHKSMVAAAVVVLVVVGLLVAGEWLRFLQKRAATAEQVNLALKEATTLQGQQKWRDALAAINRAKTFLANGSGAAALHDRAEELGKDLEMVVQLDDLRSQEPYYNNQGFKIGNALAASAYARAFEAYGIDVLGAPPEQVVASIQARGIREQLVAALDDWILVPDAGVRERLRAVAELADPDEWRNSMRQAVVANDRRALEELAARPEVADFSPASGYLLAQALSNAGAGPGAVQVLPAVQQRHPQDFWLNFQLGCQLLWGPGVQHHHNDAAGYLRAALVARPDDPVVYMYLGIALPAPEHLDEVIALNRKAIELSATYVSAHHNLALALLNKGLLDEAVAEYREAIRLNKEEPNAHYSLGCALEKKGQRDEAIAEFREAVRLNKDYADAHNNLGIALLNKGLLDEAIAESREAIRLNKEEPDAHGALGRALLEEGRFAEACASTRRRLDLLPQGHPMRHVASQQLQQCERLLALEQKLPDLLAGKLRPADAAERLELALFCQEHKKLYAAAVRWYAEAFAAQPPLADDLNTGQRYNAACAAALAGCGRGEDAGELEAPERARLRRLALDWLRTDRAAWDQLLAKEPDKARAAVQQTLRHWQQDPDLAGVRGDALAKLPEADRQPWQQLWVDVLDTLARAEGKTGPEKDSPKK
jgi:serine/threonine protein kinase/Tfp pilus assembly protein PilF